MTFFEVFWHGEAISDHTDPQDALLEYALVRPEDGDWTAACAVEGADPHLLRYESFEAFLHNADALETIPVSAAMIEAALADQEAPSAPATANSHHPDPDQPMADPPF